MTRPTLLLVHGAWAGAFAWDPVASALDERNLKWKAIDRVGSNSKKKFGWFVSASDVADDIIMEARRIDGPVVLVGHSAGGMAISGAAARAPEEFTGLVYLCALLPRGGDRLLKLVTKDQDSDFGGAVKPNLLKGIISLDRSRLHEYLFHDCGHEVADEYIARLGDESIRLGIAKFRSTPGFDAMPKHYVACTEDRTMSPSFQKWMVERQSVTSYSELTSGHMPMCSQPETLANRLAKFVRV